MISYYFEDTDFIFKGKTLNNRWLRLVAESEIRRIGDISIIFCSDNYLLDVNQQYLQHDYFTDIITFDYCEGDKLSGDLFISVDSVRENAIEPDVIYSCGPMPMLKAIKNYAEEIDIPAYISLEERMACGVGACLGCVCKTTHKDHHSHVNNARICTDGPVFEAKEVEI
jgi:NAD(P)H-flavin reductase